MDNEFESIIKAIKNIKLKEEEKSAMRANLFGNMEYHFQPEVKQSWRVFDFFAPARFRFAPAFIMILIVVLSGGISAFAENAAPGDLLYGMKININEPLAGIFAFTKEDQTVWQEKLVERRLSEAQKLVSKNNLNETARAGLENQIKNQIDKFNTDAKQLALQKNQSEDSANLNIRLQASLNAYQDVLGRLSSGTNVNSGTKQETGKLLATLSQSSDQVKNNYRNLGLGTETSRPLATSAMPSTLSVPAEGNNPTVIADQSLAETKQKVAESLLNSIKPSYQREKVNLSANIQSQIDSKLTSAETSLADGKAALAAADYQGAIDAFQAAADSINAGRLLMLSNAIKSDIENEAGIGKSSGDIEDDDFGGTKIAPTNPIPSASSGIKVDN